MKQSKIGTIPLFIAFVAIISLVVLACYLLAFYIASRFIEHKTFLIISIAIIGSIFFLLILNIPIRRKKNDPSADLFEKSKLISNGAWTNVFKANSDSFVVKQLYFCGWGHNDYTDHLAPVFGSKKAGKWTPFVIWFIHNYMLLYQAIGLKRRKRFQQFIPYLGTILHVDLKRLRYSQEYVTYDLTPETCPDNLLEQLSNFNALLENYGLYIDDVHARNVRVDKSGQLIFIDGELYSDGEERVKSFLVRGFNGPTVKGMNKVLGFERIVAWDDHRTSVEGIYEAYLAKKKL